MEWKLFWRYALDLSVFFPAAFLCLAPVWEFLPAPRRTLGAAAAFLLGGTLGAAALCARFRLDSNDLLLPLALLAFLLYLRALRGALSIWRAAFSFFSACFLLVVCSVLSVLLNARAELASSAPVCQASTALLCLGLAALVSLLSALTAVPWTRWLLQEYESEGIWRAIWLLPAGYTGIYLLSMPRFPQETELLLLDRVQEISVLTCLLPLGVYLLFLYLFYVIGRESARNLRLTEENHVLAVESHRYEQLRNYLEKTRTLRHDFRQHLRVISGLSEAGELEELRKQAEASGAQEDAQRYNDMVQMCERFEKKLHDLELTRMISIQMGPQTRLLQNNDTLMVEKIQSSLVNTIPLWKSQMVLALGMEHSRQATAAQSAVTEMTNELLKKNADMLKTGTIATAKEAERSIVDIETLKHTNEQLISTLDEVLNIQRDGAAKRKAAEVELGKIEGELKQKLMELHK